MHAEGFGAEAVAVVAGFAVAAEEVAVAEVGGDIGGKEVGAAEADLCGELNIGIGGAEVLAVHIGAAAGIGEEEADACAHVGGEVHDVGDVPVAVDHKGLESGFRLAERNAFIDAAVVAVFDFGAQGSAVEHAEVVAAGDGESGDAAGAVLGAGAAGRAHVPVGALEARNKLGNDVDAGICGSGCAGQSHQQRENGGKTKLLHEYSPCHEQDGRARRKKSVYFSG